MTNALNHSTDVVDNREALYATVQTTLKVTNNVVDVVEHPHGIDVGADQQRGVGFEKRAPGKQEINTSGERVAGNIHRRWGLVQNFDELETLLPRGRVVVDLRYGKSVELCGQAECVENKEREREPERADLTVLLTNKSVLF